MKNRKLLCFLAFIILGVLTLVSCKTEVSATGKITENYVTRYTMNLTATVDDPQGEITSGSVQIGIFDEDGNKKTFKTCDKLPITDSEENSQTVTITTLDANTKYTVKLLCTIREENVTLYETQISTNKVGTDSDQPILISSVDDFDSIKNDYSGYYQLANDIEIGTEEEYKDWTPLFTSSSSAFTGTFDGNGHTIKYFKQSSSYSYYGLFGYVSSGATIKNLNIDSCSIETSRSSDTWIGAVAGYLAKDAKLENVSVTNCSIKATASDTATKLYYIGGAVGQNDSGSLVNVHVSSTTFEIKPPRMAYIGGLVGQNDSNADNFISNSTADTVMSITQNHNGTSIDEKTDKNPGSEFLQVVGGLVGINKNTGKIYTCAANVKLTSVYSLSKNTQNVIYAKKDPADESENPEKEWKIRTNNNVVIGTFIGINGGIIKSCASSGSVDFTSLSAFSVKIGLFGGTNLDSGKIDNCGYFDATKENKFKIVLAEADVEDPVEGGSETESKSTNDAVPEYERVLLFGFMINPGDGEIYYESPVLELSSSFESKDLGESSANYKEFGFTEKMIEFFESLA